MTPHVVLTVEYDPSPITLPNIKSSGVFFLTSFGVSVVDELPEVAISADLQYMKQKLVKKDYVPSSKERTNRTLINFKDKETKACLTMQWETLRLPNF